MSSAQNPGPIAPPPPVWDARPPSPTATGYGGFWLRVVAYVIDSIVLSLAGGVLGVAIAALMSAADQDSINFAILGVGLVSNWLYFALLESSQRGATLGKMAVGLRVATEQG